MLARAMSEPPSGSASSQEIASSAKDDLFALPRVPVVGTESFREFTHRVRTAQRAGGLQLRLERVAERFGIGRPTQS